MRELRDWFDVSGRDLPWREPVRDPWGVLVSEVMLQQTQVDRVLPHWVTWMRRWPRPSDLAGATPADAIRQWGRLGYPRRAVRLQAAAVLITERHEGAVPDTYEALRALPGVGDYTASAVLAFAFRRRIPVLDTNVRRCLARAHGGVARPGQAAVSPAERSLAESLLPAHPEQAAALSEAWMELGALVCTARQPNCAECPLASSCVWNRAGKPRSALSPTLRRAAYAGSDRQVRGAIMAVLRASDRAVSLSELRARLGQDPHRADRALKTLVADQLVVMTGHGHVALPGDVSQSPR